jgi:hypothetical protein
MRGRRETQTRENARMRAASKQSTHAHTDARKPARPKWDKRKAEEDKWWRMWSKWSRERMAYRGGIVRYYEGPNIRLTVRVMMMFS